MQRPQNSGTQPKGKWVCPDADFLSTYPTLAQGMCDAWWDDGKPREPWILTVSFGTHDVQIAITDRGLSQSLYTTAESLTEGLAMVETVLSAGSTSWRKWKGK